MCANLLEVSGWTCVTMCEAVTFLRSLICRVFSPRVVHVRQRGVRMRGMFRGECGLAQIILGFTCRLVVALGCFSLCTQNAHSQTSHDSNLLLLLCPGLLSAIHFPVSEPSIIGACPQMLPRLLKTMEGSDVHTERHWQARKEKGFQLRLQVAGTAKKQNFAFLVQKVSLWSWNWFSLCNKCLFFKKTFLYSCNPLSKR